MKILLRNIFLWLLLPGSLFAQEQLGLKTSTYAGLHSAYLNPAATASYPMQWELNLFSIGAFFDNNFAFITDTSTPDLIRNGEELMPGFNDNSPNSNLKYDFYAETNTTRYLNLSTKVNGPSLMFKTNNGQSLGIFYNFRLEGGMANIPGTYNYYYFADRFVLDRIPLTPVNFSTMLWSELGAHFSQEIETYQGKISFGLNAKFLQGYEATYVDLNNMTYSMSINADTVNVEGVDVNFGYTTTNVDMLDGSDELQRRINGQGVAFDLGFNYIVDGYEDNYAWKVGISLLDFGSVKFNRNAEAHRIDTENFFEVSEATYKEFTTLAEVQDQISLDALGATTTSLERNNFRIWVPSAISIQADVNVWEGLFVSGLLMQRLAFADNHLRRGNLLNISPRYQHKWGEIHFPITLYEYKDLNMGLALRLGFLTIGTDNLGSFTKSREYTGTDFYIGLKIFPFSSKLTLGGLNLGGKGGKKVKCYDF